MIACPLYKDVMVIEVFEQSVEKIFLRYDSRMIAKLWIIIYINSQWK